MEILFINRSLNGGGSEKAMALLANEMVKMGHDVSMVLLYDEPHTYYIDEKIKLIECFCPIKGNKLIWHIKRIVTIRKVLKQAPAKYIISFMWDINMNVILAATGLGKSVIASERCDPNNEKRKLIKFAMRFVLPYAYHTVFQTDDVRRCYPKVIQKHSTVIPNMVFVSNRTVPITERKDEIVAVGRLTPQKNYRMLISAFAKFHMLYPEFVLKIYGTGSLRNALTDQAKRLNVADSVILKGYCANVLDEIKSSRIYVNSSDFEGISNAMLEALSLGLVCICTDCPVGGARLSITDCENGLLIPVNDQDELLASLKKVVENPEFEKKISQNAIKSCERFSPETITNMWLKILE